MQGERVPALLTVLAGRFESQPLAFAALVDAADAFGVTFDLAEVDVIREAIQVRLAHYFRPQVVARLEQMQGEDDTIIILRPGPLTGDPRFPGDGRHLRLLGRFAGEIIDPPDGPG